MEQLACNADQIRPDANLGEDLDCDSIDIIEITMMIEDELDIVLEDDEVIQCQTVQNLINLVVSKAGA